MSGARVEPAPSPLSDRADTADTADVDALAALLVRFGELVTEQLRIRELDINPLLASAEGLLALDARIVLHDAAVADTDLPRPALC